MTTGAKVVDTYPVLTAPLGARLRLGWLAKDLAVACLLGAGSSSSPGRRRLEPSPRALPRQ